MLEQRDKVLELQGITKQYGERVLFQKFDLTVFENEMVCIAGPSGSGKSTILNIIGMFEKQDAGVVKYRHEVLPKADSKAGKELMRNNIFYMFQNFALVENESVDYNLEIPLLNKKLAKQKKRELKNDALRRVGLKVALKEKIFHLSGGEQQRVAMARGYLKDFDLLLADEPTGSLDEGNRDEIIALLKDFQKEGKTIVIVSHDPVVMKSCDRVVNIK